MEPVLETPLSEPARVPLTGDTHINDNGIAHEGHVQAGYMTVPHGYHGTSGRESVQSFGTMPKYYVLDPELVKKESA